MAGIVALTAQAATTVSGPISVNTTWRAADGPFEVTSDVSVQGSAVLTIEAGTRVLFRAGTGLSVEQGTLRALGRADAPIVLTSVRDAAGDTPSPGDWGQLAFRDGTNDTGTILEHVVVRYGTGVSIERASPTLNFLRMESNAGPAVSIDLASSPTGSGLSAEDNQLDGILVPAGETQGDVVWALVGIPYVVASGLVSVGAAPRIQFAVPATVDQGGTTTVNIVGTRLAGADSIVFASPQLSGRILGATDTSVQVEVTAAPGAALGSAAFELQADAGRASAAAALSVAVPLPPITASGIDPVSIRRGQSLPFVVTGTSLQGAAVSISSAGVTVSGLQTASTQVTFTLSAADDAALGAATLTFSNPRVARGTASLQVQVNRALPRLVVSPAILAIPPDGTTRQFRVGLTEADDVDRVLSLAVGDTAFATVDPQTVQLPAGQTQQTVSVRGTTLGQTVLNVASPGLTPLAVPLYVTPDFNSINTAYSRQVRVARAEAPVTQPSATVTPLVSRTVQLGSGRYVERVNPSTLTVGSVAQELVISGAGLEGVTAVAFTPPEGITLSNIAPAADGRSVRVLATVAADAPLSPRLVTLAGAHQPYVAVSDAATRVLIVPPPPRIASIQPIVIARGASGTTLTVRGENLQNVQSLTFSPPEGISVGTPASSADGATLTVGLNVAADAPTGPRVLTIRTAAGSSDPLPSAANTLQVVSAVGAAVTPVLSRNVRVLKPDGAAPSQPTAIPYSRLVRLAAGPHATGLSPAAGSIGETITLTIAGYALQAVTAVEFIPSTGLTAGAVTVSPDGASVQLAVGIATDAPQTLRQVRVLAGTQELPFVEAARSLFRVTAPQPAMLGIDPIAIQAGAAPRTLVINGRNFQNAELVRVVPPEGVTVGLSPSVNADGTELRVSIAASADAPRTARVVVVRTPAGETAAEATPANTLQVVQQLGAAVTPLLSGQVRVLKQAPAAQPDPLGPVVSREVKVRAAEAAAPPQQQSFGLHSPTARVARGAAAFTSAPGGIVAGSAFTLTIRGVGLGAVTAVSFSPAADITLDGAPLIAADGASLTVQGSAGAAAALGPRTIKLSTAGGSVEFVDPSQAVVVIAGTAAITSIQPIAARRGEQVSLVIRGSNLTSGARVTVEPPDGITLEPSATAEPSGDLRIRLQVAPDAPLGPRVVRVTTPAGTTTATGSPENTLTIFP